MKKLMNYQVKIRADDFVKSEDFQQVLIERIRVQLRKKQ